MSADRNVVPEGFAFVSRRLPVRGQPNPHRQLVKELGFLTDRYYRVRTAVSEVLSLTLMGQLVFPSLQPVVAARMGAFASAAEQPTRVGQGDPYTLGPAALARGFSLGIEGLLGRSASPPKDPAG